MQFACKANLRSKEKATSARSLTQKRNDTPNLFQIISIEMIVFAARIFVMAVSEQ